MNGKQAIVRVQLGLLLMLAALVVYRVMRGPATPRGNVVFASLDDRELRHAALAAEASVPVVIRATGSFDSRGPEGQLAAYAWMIRRSDRSLVWSMNSGNVEPGRGTLAHVRDDTLVLGPGEYDVYFASFGVQARRGGPQQWRRDRRHWEFVLRAMDRQAPLAPLVGAGAGGTEALWRAAPLENDQRIERFFRVNESTQLSAYAIGQIERRPEVRQEDYSWIEEAVTGRRVWQLSESGSEPAGGSPANRRFRGPIALDTGYYRAVALTGQSHAYDAWVGNPPFDPGGWGLMLSGADPAAVSAFDPWQARTPLISLVGVGDDEHVSEWFEVHEPTAIVVYALGEMTGVEDRYDYAELVDEAPGRTRTMWSMSWQGSVHAGGSRKNRREIAFLSLEPGPYVLRYRSDGSHSAEDWNAARPDFPERWGVTIFALDEALAEESVTVGRAPDVAPEARAPSATPTESVIWTRLEGSVRRSYSFNLERSAHIHIRATGEISARNQYDYGWIFSTDLGEPVWEMTYENTVPAGGSQDNRKFDGIVELDAGQYILYFETDGSHHFGDFEGAPDNPEEWGLTLQFVSDGP